MADQDSVALLIDRGEGAMSATKLERGVNPLSELGKRYKIVKDANAQPAVPTTVEIYFD